VAAGFLLLAMVIGLSGATVDFDVAHAGVRTVMIFQT